MCMKYVNAFVGCCESVVRDNANQILSYHGPFNSIQAIEDESRNAVIADFSIVTHINLMGSSDKHASGNIIRDEGKLSVTIRLTKCIKDDPNPPGIDLDSFELDVKDLDRRNKVSQACYPFINYTRVTKIDKVSIPPDVGVGKYVIKVLVSTSENPVQVIQSMSALQITV